MAFAAVARRSSSAERSALVAITSPSCARARTAASQMARSWEAGPPVEEAVCGLGLGGWGACGRLGARGWDGTEAYSRTAVAPLWGARPFPDCRCLPFPLL